MVIDGSIGSLRVALQTIFSTHISLLCCPLTNSHEHLLVYVSGNFRFFLVGVWEEYVLLQEVASVPAEPEEIA